MAFNDYGAASRERVLLRYRSFVFLADMLQITVLVACAFYM